jgi:hypothetical protein
MSGHCPSINGQKPNEEYDLDNQSHLIALGFNPNSNEEKADKYVHYPHCDWVVIEWKGSAVPKAIRQIETTVEHLVKNGKKVDFAIIIKKRLNRFEQRTYKRRRRDRVLIDPHTQDPYTVHVGSAKLNILLLYYSEANSDNQLDKYLSGGSD